MKLVDCKVSEFIERLASDAPAPGGGSASALMGAPSIAMRSVTSTRCGLLNRPTRRPSASRRASIMTAVLPLPLVPATWMTG